MSNSSEALLEAEITQNIQKKKKKMLQKNFHLTNLGRPLFKNDDVIKNVSGITKKSVPKSFQINSRKSHKISKRFDEKQIISRQKMKMGGSTGPLPG